MSDAHAPAPHNAPKHEDKTVTTISNVLAIVGFAILIVIVIWGLLHIASLSSGWFGDLFPTANHTSTITVNAPSSALSGEPVRVAWNYSTKDQGRYAFLYECSDGLDFGLPVLREGDTKPSLIRVPCGAAFTLGNATSSIIIVPILGATSTSKTANMTVLFVPSNNGTTAQGTATMAVNVNTAMNAAARPTATTTPQKRASKPAPPSTIEPARPATPADLAVTIQSISTDPTGLTTAMFDIQNIGGRTSGTYYFTAILPTAQAYTYLSQPQVPLAPGSHVVNTLRFSQTISGIFSVTVSGDSNASNNSASQQIYGGYYRSY